MDRRVFIKQAVVVAGVASFGSGLIAAEAPKPAPIISPNKLSLADSIKAITKGKKTKGELITLVAPDIAENGAVVPVKVEINHPMEAKNYVKAIHIMNEKNQNSRCASVFLTSDNGAAYFSTRVKLGESQKVVAIAELSNGTFLQAEKEVKVTIGGCG